MQQKDMGLMNKQINISFFSNRKRENDSSAYFICFTHSLPLPRILIVLRDFKKDEKWCASSFLAPQTPAKQNKKYPTKMDRCDAGVIAENDTDTVVKRWKKKDRKTATLIFPPAP